MAKVNKITMFDACVDGDINKFRSLIDTSFTQFNRFYQSYKDTFVNTEELHETIIFEKENENASFIVVCDTVEAKKSTDKDINIIKETNGYKFVVQPIKDNYELSANE